MPGAETCSSAKSSRLCIKNLPKHITEQRFRDKFALIGEVTDVKILKTKDGKPRQIGFVGFRTVQDAAKAKGHFDRTFLDTSRIHVEYAFPVGDSKLARPWSRYSKGSSSYQKAHPEPIPKEEKKPESAKFKKTLDNVEEDNKFQEFLSAMKPRSKGNFWDNDANEVQTVPNKKPGGEGLFVKKVHKRFDTDETPKPASDSEKEDVVFDDSDDSDEDNDAFQNPGLDQKPDSRPSFPDQDIAAVLSEIDEQTSSSSDDDDDNEEPHDSDEAAPDQVADDIEKETAVKEEVDGGLPDVCDTARVFIRNLSFAVTEDDLAAAFRPFGDIIEVNVPVDDLGRSKGFAMIQFSNGASALRAMSKMDGQVFQGRLLHCLPGRSKPEPVTSKDEPASTHKQKVNKQRKAEALQGFNWNSLFINTDTAAQATADGQAVNKSDLVGPEAKNAALNMALAETNVIQQTKDWLANEAGVNIGAFENLSDKRSSNVIIVKNIPFDCTEEEIRDIFQKHGQVLRCALPPSRALALVEMGSNPTARRAFAALAYSKFHHLPLYLQWAPQNVWGNTEERTPAVKEELVELKNLDDQDGDPIIQATLFVKNLNFSTTEDSLRELFKRYSVRSVRIAKKLSAGKSLSRGYGFVEFENKDMAMEVLKKMQGVELDEHKLVLSLSNQKQTSDEKRERKTDNISQSKLSQSKLIVKNVPFEASIKELRELFQTFGAVKSCRIPNKFGGGHRGFAFVEFTTSSGAEAAKKALEATHFYGRHLVISYAKKDESLDELREKAAVQSSAIVSAAGKKRKAQSDDDGFDDLKGFNSTSKRRLI